MTIRETCRLCGSGDIVRSIPLAEVPIVSPNVGTERDEQGGKLTAIAAPLDTYLCRSCGLIQLIHVVDPSLIYRNYLYRTSISMGLAEHFRELCADVSSRLELGQGELVVEFGSNDGTLLEFFRERGIEVQGVDPAVKIAAEATARGIPTRADFFTPGVAGEIAAERGQARAILSNNAMANIDDLATILAGVREVMSEDGAFVFETQYALDVLEKTLLDVIYHEHISTFSVQPVARALHGHGLELFDAERIATKGGSIRFWIQHEGGPHEISRRVGDLIELERGAGLYDLAYHARFSERVGSIRRNLHRLIDEARARGGKIAGFGTSVGCAALIHQFALEDKLDLLFDDTPFKGRLEGPGYDLPVYTGDSLAERDPALVIVLAWRYAKPIMDRQAIYREKGGRFVVPLPQVGVMGL